MPKSGQLLVFMERGCLAAAVGEDLVEYAEFRGPVVVLLQKGYAYVLEEHDPAAGVGAVLAREYAQQGGLPGAVRGYQGYLVTLIDVESYVLE